MTLLLQAGAGWGNCCAFCNLPNGVVRCAHCNAVQYCNSQCRDQDWSRPISGHMDKCLILQVAWAHRQVQPLQNAINKQGAAAGLALQAQLAVPRKSLGPSLVDAAVASIACKLTPSMNSCKPQADELVDSYLLMQMCFQQTPAIPNEQPPGMINTGVICYANAVLQCMLATPGLNVYLTSNAHSLTCCMAPRWCLMCELSTLSQTAQLLKGKPGALLDHRGIIRNLQGIIPRYNEFLGDGAGCCVTLPELRLIALSPHAARPTLIQAVARPGDGLAMHSFFAYQIWMDVGISVNKECRDIL